MQFVWCLCVLYLQFVCFNAFLTLRRPYSKINEMLSFLGSTGVCAFL